MDPHARIMQCQCLQYEYGWRGFYHCCWNYAILYESSLNEVSQRARIYPCRFRGTSLKPGPITMEHDSSHRLMYTLCAVSQQVAPPNSVSSCLFQVLKKSHFPDSVPLLSELARTASKQHRPLTWPHAALFKTSLARKTEAIATRGRGCGCCK